MKMVSGLFVGPDSAAMVLGLGFAPDQVTMQAQTATSLARMMWNRHQMRTAVAPEGIQLSTDNKTALVDGAGIELYYGGDLITAASENYQVHISNSAVSDLYGGDMRDRHAGSKIRTWTKTTTVQGKWNAMADATYVGAGSRVLLRAAGSNDPWREFGIVTMGDHGEATDETDFSNEPPWAVADVGFISYMKDFVACPAGVVMPAGITINEHVVFNAAVNTVIEAIQW